MTESPTARADPGRSALRRLEALLRARGGLVASLLPPEGTGAGSRHTREGAPAAVPLPPPDGAPAGSRLSREGTAVGSLNGTGPAQIVAAGPRAHEHAAEYELLVEAIYEGYLLHYGVPRLLRPPEDDLGLLAGDELYALGLARLVALGDLAAVAELADVIALTALAQGEGQSELAQAIWDAGARAIGWGGSEAHRRAKALARAGEPQALEAMRAAAAP